MKSFQKSALCFICIILLLRFSAVQVYPGWFKHYGGSSNDDAFSIEQTSEGGYIVAGKTNSYSYGAQDFGIYKLDSSGNKTWFKHYGGSDEDQAYSIQQTSDGGYIVAGYTDSFTYGNSDFAIYKLDSSGNKTWFKHYGGTSLEKARSIQQTSDGGYIIAGYSNSYTYGSFDFAIYKLDSSGNKTWFKHYGGSDSDEAFSIQQTSDGGYIVAGRTESYIYGSIHADIAIYKLDSNGNKVWFKHYGGTDYDDSREIQETSDGGYVVAGYTFSYSHGQADFAIYKLDSSGNKVWFKHYGGTDYDYGKSIQQTSDGGYVVVGDTRSYTFGNEDFAIYKLNSSGNKVWFKHYGGSSNDSGYSNQQTTEGGYVVAGNSVSYSNGGSDFAIYKLDSNGNK